jgi:hypothetical protein
MDLTKLTDAELLSIDDDAIRVEKHRRDNLAKMPLAKTKVDDAIAGQTHRDMMSQADIDKVVEEDPAFDPDTVAFPKLKAAGNVVVTQDEIDGDYVVADVSGMADPDAAMNVLLDDGAIFKANGCTPTAPSSRRGILRNWRRYDFARQT